MPQRRQFPVQDGHHARLIRMEYEVVHAIVTVYHRSFIGCGNVLRQPGDEPIHGWYFFRLRGLVLARPARDLAGEVIARFAVIGESRSGIINRVQRGDDTVHFVVYGGALKRRQTGQGLLPENPPLDTLHDVERAPEHRLVLAKRQHARHRDAALPQRAHDTIFTLDGVCGRQ